MWKKVLAIIVAVSIIFSPLVALAQDSEDEDWRNDIETIDPPTFEVDGSFTHIEQDVPAPFGGYLFNPLGMSSLLAQYDHNVRWLQLEYNFREKRQDAWWKLKLEIEIARADSAELELELRLDAKNDEIEYLRTQIRKHPNNFAPLIFAGGVVLGVIQTIVIFAVAGDMGVSWQSEI
tara:strand:+ start:664 stop:1194 length:531 start_codon:yes stop_codon:yes gene_type:complete